MQQTSAWTISIGRVGGVPLRIHLTFLLLLVLVAFEASSGGSSPLPEVLFVLALFGSVLVHELGHVLVARQFGIRARDITLYPFGGVASFLREAGPRAGLAIAAAGPIMNAFIALALAPSVEPISDPTAIASAPFVTKLFAANVFLVAFNLLPAFPMDGAHIIKSLLAIFQVRKGLDICVRLSQAVGVLIGLAALLTGNPFLIVIAVVVFGYSLQELFRARAVEAGQSLSAADAMIPICDLVSFTHGTSIPKAVDRALRSLQPLFPITYAGGLLGTVDRQELLRAAASGHEDSYIGSIASKDIVAVSPDEPISRVTDLFQSAATSAVFVLKDQALCGILFKDRLYDLLLIQGLRAKAEAEKDLDNDFPLP